jgi:hypothetical protein
MPATNFSVQYIAMQESAYYPLPPWLQYTSCIQKYGAGVTILLRSKTKEQLNAKGNCKGKGGALAFLACNCNFTAVFQDKFL